MENKGSGGEGEGVEWYSCQISRIRREIQGFL